MAALKEVKYRCANSHCKNEQIVTYFADDTPLPFTLCVKCKAGFGKDTQQILIGRQGMFPVGEPLHILNDPTFSLDRVTGEITPLPETTTNV